MPDQNATGDKATKWVYSSYHMRFLESHEGHSPTNNSLPACPSQTICQSQEEQEHLSDTPLQPEGSVIEVEEDNTLLHPDISVVQNPLQDSVQLPQWSAWVPISTNTPWRLGQAIQATRESIAQIKQHKEERQKTLEDLHATPITHQPQGQATSTLDQVPQEPYSNELDITDTGQIETTLAAVMEIVELDPSSLEAGMSQGHGKMPSTHLIICSENLDIVRNWSHWKICRSTYWSPGVMYHKDIRYRRDVQFSKFKGKKMERLTGGRFG